MERVSIRVPATSANMGPGFDSFGCALSLYNVYTFEIIEKGLEISGCPEEYCNSDNLSIVAYRDAMTAMGLPMDPCGCPFIPTSLYVAVWVLPLPCWRQVPWRQMLSTAIPCLKKTC